MQLVEQIDKILIEFDLDSSHIVTSAPFYSRGKTISRISGLRA